MLFVRIAVVTGKTLIDVPTGIAGVVWMRETYRKAPEAVARYPAPLSNKPIKSIQEHRGVHCFLKGSAAVAGQPDDGFCPRCRIMAIEGDVPPHDVAALLGKFPGKSAVDADEPIPNELFCRRVAGDARAQTVSADLRGDSPRGYRAPAHGSGWDAEVRAEAIGEMGVVDKAP